MKNSLNLMSTCLKVVDTRRPSRVLTMERLADLRSSDAPRGSVQTSQYNRVCRVLSNSLSGSTSQMFVCRLWCSRLGFEQCRHVRGGERDAASVDAIRPSRAMMKSVMH